MAQYVDINGKSAVSTMLSTYGLKRSKDIVTIEMIREFMCRLRKYSKEDMQILQHIALDMKKRKTMGVTVLSLAHYYARALESVYPNNGVPHRQLVSECYYEMKEGL